MLRGFWSARAEQRGGTIFGPCVRIAACVPSTHQTATLPIATLPTGSLGQCGVTEATRLGFGGACGRRSHSAGATPCTDGPLATNVGIMVQTHIPSSSTPAYHTEKVLTTIPTPYRHHGNVSCSYCKALPVDRNNYTCEESTKPCDVTIPDYAPEHMQQVGRHLRVTSGRAFAPHIHAGESPRTSCMFLRHPRKLLKGQLDKPAL